MPRAEGPEVLLSVYRWSCCFASQDLGEEEFSSSQFELSYWKEPSAWERHPCCGPQHEATKSQCVVPCAVRGSQNSKRDFFPPAVCWAGLSQGCISFMHAWILYKTGAREKKIYRNHMHCTPSKHNKTQQKMLKVGAEPYDSVNQTQAEKHSPASPVIAF